MFVFVTENFKSNSSTINLSDEPNNLTIAIFVIEEHCLTKEISRILKIVHRREEHQIALYERIIIFKYVHSYTISDTDFYWKIEYKSTKDIILLRCSEFVSLIYFFENLLIYHLIHSGIIGSTSDSPSDNTVLRTEKEYYQCKSKKPCTQKDNIGDGSKHRTMIRR